MEEDQEAVDGQKQDRLLWHSSLSFAVVSYTLTHFKFVSLQVHWLRLVHWVTAGPKQNSPLGNIPRKTPCSPNSSPSMNNNIQTYTQQSGTTKLYVFISLLLTTLKSVTFFCCHLHFRHFASAPESWKQHRRNPIISDLRVKPKSVITTIVPDSCNSRNMARIIAHDDAKD